MNSLSIVAVGLLMDRHVRGSEDLRAPRARILLQIVSSLRKVRIHSAPSLLVELGSDVAARGEPPRFTPSCCKSHDVVCC